MIFSKANFANFSTSLAIQACGAATGIITARVLGPVARGELATVILWPVIFSNLGLMGCNWALAREAAMNPEREKDWVAAGMVVAMATASLYFLGGYFLLPWLLPADRSFLLPVARLCLLLIPLDICNQVLLSVEHGRMRWRRYNLMRFSFFLFYVALIGVLALAKRPQVRWFVIAFLSSHLLAALVRLWIHRNSLVTGKVRIANCRRLLRGGAPYFGATISNLVSLQLDTILVVSLLNAEAAGLYAVAAACANGQSSMSDALGITSFAVLSNETNPGSQEKIISAIFRQSALASCGTGLALSCLIPFLLVPLFGMAFARAIGPGVVLALAASLLGSANTLNQGLRGLGRPQAGALSQALGIAVMAAGALTLLRRFGPMGIAFAVLLSSGVQLGALVGAAARCFRISPLEFWPFGAETLRLFFQQIAGVRFRDLRSPA
ncbi:MAG TPA: oligosaccharide flippase family protein [Candidatus Acidoferrales bacterium]|nr:oligosaccharide flippase family protein [Candidatus Acidoferrales bacterium]